MIQVKGLTRYYDQYPAIIDIDLSIESNLIVGFLGLNGAGKSTLLKMLSRILPPHAGTIKIDGIDIWEDSDSIKQKIGYLPEEPALYRDMQVADFLKWCGQLRGMTSDQATKALPRVIEMCDLGGKEKTVIGALSHGFKKRVGIAQAVIHSPSLLVLDEPISGLDPLQIMEMRALLGRLKEDCTILVSSHILTEISQVCDRILVIKDGRVVADGSETEIATLAGAFQYLIETTNLSQEDATSFFEKIDIVKSFTFVSPFCFSVRLKEDKPEDLITAAVTEGFSVRTMTSNSEELERTFTELVKTAEGT